MVMLPNCYYIKIYNTCNIYLMLKGYHHSCIIVCLYVLQSWHLMLNENKSKYLEIQVKLENKNLING